MGSYDLGPISLNLQISPIAKICNQPSQWLTHMPFAVGLSRQTNRITRQNLYLSLGVVAVLLPATILGLGIGPAVLAHEGSTLVVVFNALRLLRYKDR